MKRTPVTSTNLKSVGYKDGDLEIEFVNGRVYVYRDVSPATHLALMNAEDIGKHFSAQIRGIYEAREIVAKPKDAP